LILVEDGGEALLWHYLEAHFRVLVIFGISTSMAHIGQAKKAADIPDYRASDCKS
jgi:hypothetical protein